MKAQTLLLLIVLVLLSSSCRTSRSMRKEMLPLRSSLYYELTSPQYLGEVKQTVHLDFINYSNLDYYTSVKKSGSFAIPLLFFNYENNSFNTRLGEGSLTQTYREFLTDALLTECNSSTCFRLRSADKITLPDSVYRLEVKIMHNETSSKIRLNSTNFIWFEGEYIELVNNLIRPASTQLSIIVRLYHKEDCLLNKTYTVNHQEPAPRRGFDNSVQANEACLNLMTESLSLATKEIVEKISQELHLTLEVLHQPTYK